MKKTLLALAFLAAIFQLTAQTKFTALKITPEFPQKGDKVTFEYNKSYGPLVKAPGVDVVIYQWGGRGGGNGYKVIEPMVTRKGNIYTGSFKLDTVASCFAFTFSSEEEKDLNSQKGYIVPVYTAQHTPVQAYYAAGADIANIWGERLLGINRDTEKGLALREEAFKLFPELKTNSTEFGNYLYALNWAKNKEAQPIILSELQKYEAAGNLTELQYGVLAQWYEQLKMKGKSDSLTAAKKVAFPNGEWVKNEAASAFNKEKDPAKKLALYNAYIAKYPVNEDNKDQIDNFKYQLAGAYAKAKDYKAYHEWNNQLTNKSLAARNNNSFGWNMAEADDNIEEAKKMSYAATTYAKNEMLKPTEKNLGSMTAKQADEQRKYNYAMYGDTYAYIMYKLGDYKAGFPYAKDAATINKLKDAELNERYALLAEKTLTTAESKKLIEQFVKDGVATSKTKEALKNIYIKEKKSDAGFDTYLAALEATAKVKKRADIAKTMINDASPRFNLKDFEGKSVSLDDLKGKIVIVDFWATWCGPCIASMPGMNKALAKYKDNENVKFLFVDTWENVDNKLENAKDFMTKKNYPFHVLMDTDDKMVGDFKVSGIPTKFVIDKEGKIRFKAIGFNGNDDELVEELSTMIELAGS